jgi:hypothetical protein
MVSALLLRVEFFTGKNVFDGHKLAGAEAWEAPGFDEFF